MTLRIDGEKSKNMPIESRKPAKTAEKPDIAKLIADFSHYEKLAKQVDALDGKKDGFINEAKIIANLTGKKIAQKSDKKPVSVEEWAFKMMMNAEKNRDKMKAKKM